MENNNLFAALRDEEPGVSLRELESYTLRKIRLRKIQIRVSLSIAIVTGIALPFTLNHTTIERSRSVITESRPLAVVQPPAQQINPQPQILHTVAKHQHMRSVAYRKPLRQVAPMQIPNEKMMIIASTLLELRAPEPPGSRESMASSFSANIIQ